MFVFMYSYRVCAGSIWLGRVVINCIKIDHDPLVGICSVWSCKGCLSVCPGNSMRHNEDVVSALEGVCHIPYRIGEKVPDTI